MHPSLQTYPNSHILSMICPLCQNPCQIKIFDAFTDYNCYCLSNSEKIPAFQYTHDTKDYFYIRMHPFFISSNQHISKTILIRYNTIKNLSYETILTLPKALTPPLAYNLIKKYNKLLCLL